MSLKTDAQVIINEAIMAAMPDTAVKKALKGEDFSSGNLYLVAIGKAAWSMAKAASDILGEKIKDGVVITKYGHSNGDLANIRIFEAGHPIPDDNSFATTNEAIKLVSHLNSSDKVLLLISGGGSALFEKPLIPASMLEELTQQLLASGANIIEMNTIRKRLSGVKGGKFAKLCEPAQIFSIVLSDIIGDPLDMIASGPAYPDCSTSEQACAIIKKYGITVTKEIDDLLQKEPPHELSNVTTKITGSVTQLCVAAEHACRRLGYEPIILTASLSCEAKEAGSMLSSIAQYYNNTEKSLAFIMGGETVVRLKGDGKGGRNQELALSAAINLEGLKDVAVFSVGSDGTDGPTDAAGGYVDTSTKKVLSEKGIDIYDVLENNDSYHALKICDGLIITGATGTNVNDLTVLLIKR
ncbi:glycerate kinase type-2 family protein [Clostridium sp. Marseille-P299]|uniref:glycerate kinase type-2 family protein n=1 Tax=Clostridium sp. Marseille-P299 TaxID=1805477 RepID=UPI000835BB81|nr:glycerate kinase [Clostridium sp. Marseille-P299]